LSRTQPSGEKQRESDLLWTLPPAASRVKTEVGGQATNETAGKTGDDPTPASDRQGMIEREIILHRFVGLLTALPGREATRRLRREPIGARRDGEVPVIQDLP
jgi:hypothetical protein